MATMQAIRLTGPCSTKELVPTTVEKPTIKTGYVLIKVKAFGVNESEITSRKGGSSSDFSYPRILGIEGAGEVAEVGEDSPFHVGQKVVTMMGGLGRGIDGSYAEYTLVREDSVIPVNVDAPWDLIGSLPEMLQTAYGSLTEGLAIQAGRRHPVYPWWLLSRRPHGDYRRQTARCPGHCDNAAGAEACAAQGLWRRMCGARRR